MVDVKHGYAMVLAYDGRAYHGWQRLSDHPTVQGAIEFTLQQITGEAVVVQGAGRTDRGAHALGQTAGFRLQNPWTLDDLAGELSSRLPEDIRVRSIHHVDHNFHPRTSAISKVYEYRILNLPRLPPEEDGLVWHVPDPLELAPMKEAIAHLIGRHDFATFATKGKGKGRSTVREMFSADMESEPGQVWFRFEADGFLMHMVRNMVRALVKVGEGRHPAAHLADILQAKRRQASPGAAPASGLYLMEVRYPEGVLNLADAVSPITGSEK